MDSLVDNVKILVSLGTENSIQYAAIAQIRYVTAMRHSGNVVHCPQWGGRHNNHGEVKCVKNGVLEKVTYVVDGQDIPLHEINAWCYHDENTNNIRPVIMYRVDEHGEYTLTYEQAKELIKHHQQLSCELFYQIGKDNAGDPWLTDSLDKIREMQERNNHDQCK